MWVHFLLICGLTRPLRHVNFAPHGHFYTYSRFFISKSEQTMLKYQTGDPVILIVNYDDDFDHIHIPKGTKGVVTDMHLLLTSYDVEFTGFGTVFLPEEMLSVPVHVHNPDTKNN